MPDKAVGAPFYSAWQASDQPLPGSLAVGAQFGDELRLEEYQVRNDRYGELVIDMIWTVLQPLDRDLGFYVALADTKGNLLHDNIYYQPVSVLWYPTSMWQPGQRIHVQTLPWQLDADQFVLAAGLFVGEDGWTSGVRLPVTRDGSLAVLEGGTLLRLGGFVRTGDGGWKAAPPLPEPFAALPLQSVDVQFGSSLWLQAAGLPVRSKAGEDLFLHLVWEATGEPPPNVSRFVHLLDAAGAKVAQSDGQVSDGLGPLPIEGWATHTPVNDLVAITLPTDLAPGDYTLVAGLYNWQSEERLPAQGERARPDAAALLGTIQVVE
jgi:hypothetical protein